jgi:hypothetical protein
MQRYLAIKNELISTSGWTDASGAPATQSHPWLVYACAANGSFANDGTDLWTDAATLEGGGFSSGNGPWMVVRHPVWNIISGGGGIDPGFSFLLHPQNYEYNSMDGRFQVAFHGLNKDGALHTFPTPVDLGPLAIEGDNTFVTLYSGTWGQGDSTAGVVMHTLCTTDGQNWRQFMCMNGDCYYAWGVEQIVDAQGTTEVAGRAWNKSAYLIWTATGNNAVVDNDLFVGQPPGARMEIRHFDETWATTGNLVFTGLVVSDQDIMDQECTRSDYLNGEWALEDPFIYSFSVGRRGYLGKHRDLWLANQDGIPTGSTFSSQALAKFGSLVVPWNGTTPIITA